MSSNVEIYRLVRETRWVKEYDTSIGTILDSKYRTFRCEANSEDFVQAWRNGTLEDRIEMEAAFAFFPAESEESLKPVLEVVAVVDFERSERMRAAWILNSGELTIDQKQFLLGLSEFLDREGDSSIKVGENRWFRAFANDAGVRIETLVSSVDEMPSEDQLRELEVEQDSVAYRHAIRLVADCRFLLVPESTFGNRGLKKK